MYRYIPKLALTLLIIVGLHSCRPILYKMFGVELMKSFDQEKYDKAIYIFNSYYKDNHILSYIGKDSDFKEYSLLDTTITNSLLQPIQILYFEEDTLKSFHANCFAKSSITGNLNWNYDNKFDYFIPKSAISVENINISLSDIKRIYKINNSTPRITVVFVWTNFLGRSSITAFKQIVDNIKLFSGDNVNIITINTDYSFINTE